MFDVATRGPYIVYAFNHARSVISYIYFCVAGQYAAPDTIKKPRNGTSTREYIQPPGPHSVTNIIQHIIADKINYRTNGSKRFLYSPHIIRIPASRAIYLSLIKIGA